MYRSLTAACFLLLSLFCATRVTAGISDTPLPRFADGTRSVEIAGVPGIVKRNRLQTEFICSSLAATPIHIGVEVFDADGNLLNDVEAGNGAAMNVGPGATVTFGTSATLAFLESMVIPLASVSQGFARIVATSPRVACNVLIVDDALTPPTSLATLGRGVDVAGAAGGPPLPRFSSGRQATHAVRVPGLVKRGAFETVLLCTSLASAPMDVGVQVFGPDGALKNDVESGNGALIAVPPGATVTFGSTGTAALLESTVIVLPGVAQGAARVVSTAAGLRCNALVLDSDLTPPASMAGLLTGAGTAGIE